MKKSHIIALLLIVAATVVIINSTGDVSTYATFGQAEHAGRVKVVGELAKDKDIIYDPLNNPNQFSFFLKDEEGDIKKVVLNKAKPQDFERSESIVVTGNLKDELFVADEILMKCPSKYKDQEISLKAENG